MSACATCAAAESRAIRLVLFPGEEKVFGVTRGRIYVVDESDAVIASYPVAAGPPVGFPDRGHTATPTPAGNYTLGPQHHHTTPNWAASSIPWGAQIRKSTDPKAGCEYQMPGRAGSTPIGGPRGVLHAALMRQSDVRRLPAETRDLKVQEVEENFCRNNEDSRYEGNDFGNWAWNLLSDGNVTPYYLHTTPSDELDASSLNWKALTPAQRESHRANLENSHGCVHIFPSDRDEMIERGYLRAGIPVEVRPYGQKGPP